ncbi:MAG: GNAT family N-acetyltransferase, partial [Lachnospiraceae bacterium]
TNVAVHPDCRNRGIAGVMLAELLHRGSLMGIEAFTLEVRAGNGSAIRLYEKAGFVTEGIRKGFYDEPKEDALIMWKR